MALFSIILSILVLVVLILKDFSTYVVTFICAFIVILLNGLEPTNTIINVYFSAFGTQMGTWFPIFYFGGVTAYLYSKSGASVTIADTICNFLVKDSQSETRKYISVFIAIVLAGSILTFGGINAAMALVCMYPIAMRLFERVDLPKRMVVGVIAGGTFVLTLSMPGSPSTVNVALMNVLGTKPTAAFIPGLIGMATSFVSMIFFFTMLVKYYKKQGLHFAYGPKDEDIKKSAEQERPGFVISLLPLIVMVVLFNAFNMHIVFACSISAVTSIVLFYKYLGYETCLHSFAEGAAVSFVPAGNMAAVIGFSAVVQSLPEFKSLINNVMDLNVSPYVILLIATIIFSGITSSSTTTCNVMIPMILDSLVAKGMPLGAIHRVAAYSTTIIDSLPHSGMIVAGINLADLKMSEGYPAVACSTVLSTTCGTLAVAMVCALFPGLC